MSAAEAQPLFDALDATWPAASFEDRAGWRLRDGAGGGKRVSAALRLRAGAAPDAAIAAMRARGDAPLFQVRPGEDDLDAELAERGLQVVDPTEIYAAPVGALTHDRPEMGKLYRCAGAAPFMAEIWAAGGVGPARLAVMARAAAPRSWLFARAKDQPVGVAFVALHGPIAMVHAIEVPPAMRRRGAGLALLQGAANYAADHGAETFALAVTTANAPARALYAKLGMARAAGYHYRQGER